MRAKGRKKGFFHPLRFCIWDLQIKLTKNRLTGETVYYVCIRGPSEKNSKDSKKWLEPESYITILTKSDKFVEK